MIVLAGKKNDFLTGKTVNFSIEIQISRVLLH